MVLMVVSNIIEFIFMSYQYSLGKIFTNMWISQFDRFFNRETIHDCRFLLLLLIDKWIKSQ